LMSMLQSCQAAGDILQKSSSTQPVLSGSRPQAPHTTAAVMRHWPARAAHSVGPG
jgi:hypothetical protein